MTIKFFRKNEVSLLWKRLPGCRLWLVSLLLWPAVLPAQNGVTISNLMVNAGTVTFNVHCDKSAMPAMWNDTLWVFVDYNVAGVMMRLPLKSGATLTAHTAPGVGKVIEEPGNNKGVWVVGNARSAGTFSATVQLLTSVNDIAGACAYASTYPPVGSYASVAKILFTGTPMYEIVLTHSGGGRDTVKSDKTFLLPCDYTLTSFNDATGAPGMIGATAFVLNASATGYCDGSAGVSFSLSGTQQGVTYQLIKDNATVVATLSGTGSAGAFSGTYMPGTYSAKSLPTATSSGVAMSGTHTVTLYPLPVISTTAPSIICYNTTAGLTAQAGSGTTTAMTYTWNVGGSISTTDAPNKTTTPLTTNTTYTVAARNAYGCMTVSGVATIPVHTEFTAGAIQSVSTTTWANTNPDITIQSVSPADGGGGGTITYQWRRSGTSSKDLDGNTSTYTMRSDMSNASTVGTYHFNRYARNNVCNTAWVAATGTYTLTLQPGTDQSQGSCTFTQPPLVGTFETFPSSYSASTFVTLTDERDGNNYAIVKIGNRWIMAQNLNYQKGLTFQQKAADPSTATGSNKDLIGSFWCSGTNGATTSTKTSCDVWGAFYSWETAMMVDGKWSDDNRNSSSWTEPVYGTSTSAGNTNNGGRGANGHGICPPNWHVTTDAELGDVLDAIETGTKSHNTGTGSWRGTNAGKGAKAACTCPTTTACASDQEAMWNRDVSSSGIDSYGFRVLPAGERYYTGSSFPYRGVYAIFWSSSAYSSSAAWRRYFYYAYSTVYRTTDSRSYGFPVRCIRDL